MIRKFAGLLVVVGMLSPNTVMAENAGSGWGNSMSFSSPNDLATAFNAALSVYNLKHFGGGAGGGPTTIECQVVGACPQGGAVSQWNGVSLTTITESDGIVVDNNIDAGGDQEADIANCIEETNNCNINLN